MAPLHLAWRIPSRRWTGGSVGMTDESGLAAAGLRAAGYMDRGGDRRGKGHGGMYGLRYRPVASPGSVGVYIMDLLGSRFLTTPGRASGALISSPMATRIYYSKPPRDQAGRPP